MDVDVTISCPFDPSMTPWHGSPWLRATDMLVSLIYVICASPLMLSACQACRSLAAAATCELLGGFPKKSAPMSMPTSGLSMGMHLSKLR